MIYIKYLDQAKITGKFQTTEQIELTKPRIVEAIGYIIKEDKLGIYIASTINGPQYNNILFIPKDAIVEVLKDNLQESSDLKIVEVSYIEAQGIDKIPIEKVDKLPKPPIVKICGFLAGETEDTLYIAQEKNIDGAFRSTTLIPKKYIQKKK